MSDDLKIFLEDLLIYLEAEEANIVQLKRQITKLTGPKEAKATLPELTFNILKWEAEEGAKLGKYEVAYQKANIPDKWQHGFNILRNNNALISKRFHENGYVYSYWIFPEKYVDRIFRKKREEDRHDNKS